MSQWRKDFLSKTLIDVIIPENSNVDFSDLQDSDVAVEESESHSFLPVKQRKLLFFDERLTIFVALRLPEGHQSSLKLLLPRLELKINAWVTEASANIASRDLSGNNHGAPRDLIYSGSVDINEDPLVVIHEQDGEQWTIVLLETTIILNRPRLRLQGPCVIISTAAVFTEDTIADDDYLPSFEPRPVNALEALGAISGFEKNPPYLPVSRLKLVLPTITTENQILSIRQATPKPVPITSAVVSRHSIMRLNTPLPTSPDAIACIDFEVTPLIDLGVTLEVTEVSLSHGRVEAMMPELLPLQCRSRDLVTLLYMLLPDRNHGLGTIVSSNNGTTVNNENIAKFSISINATVVSSPKVTSTIRIDWSINVDLAHSPNPSAGANTQRAQQLARPASLTASVSGDPSAWVSGSPHSSAMATMGIWISVTAIDQTVRVNTPFKWHVIVQNRSSKLVKLALMPLPRLQRATSQAQQYNKRHAPKGSTASFPPNERRHTKKNEEADIAHAIVDENVVYALQHQGSGLADTDIISLTAELRVGPLGPGTCHEAEITLVALKAGPLKVEAIRVVDLVREAEEGMGAQGVTTDIKDLPDIFAVGMGDQEL